MEADWKVPDAKWASALHELLWDQLPSTQADVEGRSVGGDAHTTTSTIDWAAINDDDPLFGLVWPEWSPRKAPEENDDSHYTNERNVSTRVLPLPLNTSEICATSDGLLTDDSQGDFPSSGFTGPRSSTNCQPRPTPHVVAFGDQKTPTRNSDRLQQFKVMDEDVLRYHNSLSEEQRLEMAKNAGRFYYGLNTWLSMQKSASKEAQPCPEDVGKNPQKEKETPSTTKEEKQVRRRRPYVRRKKVQPSKEEGAPETKPLRTTRRRNAASAKSDKSAPKKDKSGKNPPNKEPTSLLGQEPPALDAPRKKKRGRKSKATIRMEKKMADEANARSSFNDTSQEKSNADPILVVHNIVEIFPKRRRRPQPSLEQNVMLENLPPGQIRHVILNEFLKGTNASQAAANINKVYGEGATTERTCRRWFVKFRSGDRSLEDEPGRGSEPHLDNAALLRLLSEDNRQTTRELAEQLGVSHTAVEQMN